MPTEDYPEPYRHALWRFFNDEHGLVLTESELDDIVRVVEDSFLERRDSARAAAVEPGEGKTLRSNLESPPRSSELDRGRSV